MEEIQTPSSQPASTTTPLQPTSSPAFKRKRPVGKWLMALLVLLMAVAIGGLVWMLMDYQAKNAALEQDKKNLQTQVDELNRQLAAAKVNTEIEEEETTPCNGTVSATLKDNIKAAVTSKNYAALEANMASAVNVVFAATEKGGNVTPAQAVTDMKYLDNGEAPWNFALPAATIAGYKGGDYGQYFKDGTYVGKAADNMIVSFGFDACGKINQIFVSAADL